VKLPPGYTSRPATPDDLDEVAALIDEWDLAYFGEAEPNRVGVQYEWGAAWVDLGRDVRVVFAADGRLAAYAKHDSPVPSERYEVDAFVHPSHEGRGIGSAIIAWSEQKTLSQLAPGARTRLWNATGSPNVSGLRLFEERAYRIIRTFWQMRIDLDPSFDVGTSPEEVTVRPHRPGIDDRAAHATLDEAFSTHFGYFSEPFDAWLEHQRTDESFDIGRGFVAEVDGQIVGASINGVIDGTGWIYELGVRKGWQGRGIGRALLRRSFAMFAADGIRVARLGVDTENASGALELYRSVGMRQAREWRVYEKIIPSDQALGG
jgi:mycothiol synthase